MAYYGSKRSSGFSFHNWRGDDVAQFRLDDYLKKDQFKTYKINISPYIKSMMKKYGLDHVKLKHLEIFTEAYKGYCCFELYYCKIYILREVTSPYFLFTFTMLFIVMLLIYIIIKCGFKI